jgi:hypothetical protein
MYLPTLTPDDDDDEDDEPFGPMVSPLIEVTNCD